MTGIANVWRQEDWITDDRTGDLVKFVVTSSILGLTSGNRLNHGYLVLATGENPRQMTYPSGGPVLRIFSRPKLKRPHE